MNNYIEDGAPAEENVKYALDGFDAKDMVKLQKLECEKRMIEIQKKISRMNEDGSNSSTRNNTYNRLQNEKTCLEEKIEAYKNAENQMTNIDSRHADNTTEAGKEKMNYFFTEVSQNIMSRPCSF
jgi:hypothetical protein